MYIIIYKYNIYNIIIGFKPYVARVLAGTKVGHFWDKTSYTFHKALGTRVSVGHFWDTFLSQT